MAAGSLSPRFKRHCANSGEIPTVFANCAASNGWGGAIVQRYFMGSSALV